MCVRTEYPEIAGVSTIDEASLEGVFTSHSDCTVEEVTLAASPLNSGCCIFLKRLLMIFDTSATGGALLRTQRIICRFVELASTATISITGPSLVDRQGLLPF